MPKARVGESTRGGLPPSRKGGLGDLPREKFQIQDVSRSDFEVNFACETRLIVQTLHDAVFKLSCFEPHNQSMNSYFDPSIGLIFKG